MRSRGIVADDRDRSSLRAKRRGRLEPYDHINRIADADEQRIRKDARCKEFQRSDDVGDRQRARPTIVDRQQLIGLRAEADIPEAARLHNRR